MIKLAILVVLMISMQSCVAIKEYDKLYINDPDMKLTAKAAEKYETTFQVYREAAAGANGGKTGGGCGCN
ncbi:arginine decarboxylase [Flavobacterium faecale]|uniref:Arginine decarboxylase n=1 Tax=Flavobacterium faecale TaxID=1355330 RepID=A0A2S1LFG5_9FLAO|nr:DUF4266 domain-containing protein [Flavobacterium faecale]AWG22448.1 arginine decarboxylase [Flavobacterium faecale]